MAKQPNKPQPNQSRIDRSQSSQSSGTQNHSLEEEEDESDQFSISQVSQYPQQVQHQQDQRLEVSYNEKIHFLSFKKLQNVKISIQQLKHDQQFIQLILKNNYLLVELLSQKKTIFSLIAQHSTIMREFLQFEDNIFNFSFLVEKGDQNFVGDDQFEKRSKLWEKGATQVLKWLRCLALGIVQLQQAGIFHLDLALRNTIKVAVGNQFRYKLIDFDYAFRVDKPNQKICPIYNTTKIIIDYLLNKNVSWLINYMFNGLKSGDIIYERLTEVIKGSDSHESKIDKIAHLLRDFSFISHQKQFKRLLLFVLESAVYLTSQQRKEIEEKIDSIDVGSQWNYDDYIKVIQKLGDYLLK